MILPCEWHRGEPNVMKCQLKALALLGILVWAMFTKNEI